MRGYIILNSVEDLKDAYATYINLRNKTFSPLNLRVHISNYLHFTKKGGTAIIIFNSNGGTFIIRPKSYEYVTNYVDITDKVLNNVKEIGKW